MKKKLLNEIGECFSLLFHFQFTKLFLTPTENQFLKFCRYAFVGAVASLVDWFTLYIYLQGGFNYLIGTMLGFFTGLTTNFLMSKKMVFNSDKENINSNIEFIVYFLIGLSGLLLTLLLMYLAVDKISLPVMASRIVITLIVLFYNYFSRLLFYAKLGSKIASNQEPNKPASQHHK